MNADVLQLLRALDWTLAPDVLGKLGLDGLGLRDAGHADVVHGGVTTTAAGRMPDESND